MTLWSTADTATDQIFDDRRQRRSDLVRVRIGSEPGMRKLLLTLLFLVATLSLAWPLYPIVRSKLVSATPHGLHAPAHDSRRAAEMTAGAPA